MYSWEREKCSLYGVVGVCYLEVSNVSKSKEQHSLSALSLMWWVSAVGGVHCIVRRVSVIAHMFCMCRTHWHYDQSTEITSQLHHGKLWVCTNVVFQQSLYPQWGDAYMVDFNVTYHVVFQRSLYPQWGDAYLVDFNVTYHLLYCFYWPQWPTCIMTSRMWAGVKGSLYKCTSELQ